MNFHWGKKSGKFKNKLGSHFLVRLNKAQCPGARACAAGRPEKTRPV